MKKLLSVLLILSLLCMIAMPVFATDKSNDIEDIRLMLEDGYNGVETETQFGYFVPTFTVFKDKDGVINICADCWNFVFRDIVILNAPIEDKQMAVSNIGKHMGNIAKTLLKKYPQYKFMGWYESNYDNFHGNEETFKINTWTNIKDGKSTEKILWLTEQDSDWMTLKQ